MYVLTVVNIVLYLNCIVFVLIIMYFLCFLLFIISYVFCNFLNKNKTSVFEVIKHNIYIF